MDKLLKGPGRIWQIAAAETVNKKSKFIEKEHLFIGALSLGKLIRKSTEPVSVFQTRMLKESTFITEESIFTESYKPEKEVELEYLQLKSVFTKEFNVEETQLRRAIRNRLPEGDYIYKEDVIHRSSECKHYFEIGEEIGGGKINPFSLLIAILENPGEKIAEVIKEFNLDPNKLKEALFKKMILMKIMMQVFGTQFIGNNLSLEEYSSLNEEEKLNIQSILWENNKNWIREKFQELNAAWIAVVDGEVVAFSKDIDEYPDESEILKICEDNKGKFPFIFEDKERFLKIEESSSSWSNTVYEDDYYPTGKIQISSLDKTSKLTLTADFDTGFSGAICVSLEWLIDKKLIKPPSPNDILEKFFHLNREYFYHRRRLLISPVPEKGDIQKQVFSVVCVKDWNRSPFVEINKTRVVLVGRRLFQKIGSTVILKFATGETQIY